LEIALAAARAEAPTVSTGCERCVSVQVVL
jgi:hypothetical protein